MLYGAPESKIEDTALASAVEYASNKNVPTHYAMRFIMDVKWKVIANAFAKEVAACVVLLLSYYAIIIFEAPNWKQFNSASDCIMLLLRTIVWLCCMYLVVFVEYRELRGSGWWNYLKSVWNWLNMATYGVIIASISLEIIGGPTIPARNGLLALITVSLWINMLQYLSVLSITGVLIATMGRMVRDVGQFFILYSVFLFRFSGALHLILSDVVGYKTFVNTFLTVLLMLFCNINYDPYNDSNGWTWVFSKVLLIGYLICVVIMLLNVLIAMMAISFAITDAAVLAS